MPAPLAAPLVALLLIAIAAAALRVQRSRQSSRLLGTSVGAAPADADVLYFTGVHCTICHVAQRPALIRLRELTDDVRVREIDVAVEPHTARAYGVMTLPTTVVLDPDGRVAAVNAGYATEIVLRAQVEAARAAAVSAMA